MGDATRLAIAILVLFLAGLAFFFAFHPNGVQNATNPDNALDWLFTAFDATASGTSATPAGNPTGADQQPGTPSGGAESVNLPVAPRSENG